MPSAARAPLRSVLTALALAAAAIAWGGADAGAATVKPAAAKAATEKTAAAKPALVASFGDWGVYQGQAGKGRICYALGQPKTREPAGLTRDPAYAFISDRPAEGVRNEVSFIMGFDVSAAATADAKGKTAALAPVAAIGDQSFDLLPKGSNLWVKNAARESALIEEMRKGVKLLVRAASSRGHVTIDSYSLTGFAQAMDRLQKECPAK